MANPFVHVELQANDIEKAKSFYRKLFEWDLTDMPMGAEGSYTMIGVGEGTGGGMMKNPVKGAPSQWLAYVGVADVSDSTRKAKELGGTVLMEKHEVAGYGWLGIIADPTGAVLGLWQPMKK